jgi:drug/metabolite transporter (DMT)-like permease
MLAWIVFHENIGRRFTMGIGAILMGSVLLSWQGVSLGGTIVGPIVVILACLCWAVDNNLTQKVSAGNPIQIAAIKGLVAGSVNLLLGVWLGNALPNAFFLSTALVVGFFSYGLALVFFVFSLRTLGTARTGAYFSTAPLIGAILALVVWREPVTPIFLAASGAMVAGVLLLMTERHVHLHFHEPLIHNHLHLHDEHHHHRHNPNDPAGEPHSHLHEHVELTHSHPHYPDIHHRHSHDRKAAVD